MKSALQQLFRVYPLTLEKHGAELPQNKLQYKGGDGRQEERFSQGLPEGFGQFPISYGIGN